MTLQKDNTPHTSSSQWTMWMSMITMALAFVIWSMVSPIAPQIQKLYHLPLFDKSLLVAIPVLLGSLLRIPLGMLADRFGGRRVYTLLMLFILIPLAGMATANSLPLLLFWEVLLGAAGASFAVGIAHVSVWFPSEKQGLALGITAFGNIGTAIAGFIIPSIYLHVGFSNTFFIMMIPAVIGAALIAFFTKDPVRKVETNSVHTPIVHARESFWSNPQLWLLSFYYFITFGGFVAFGNYLPTLLQQQFHLSPVSSGMRAAGFVVLATVLRPIGGYLADRIAAQRLLQVTFLFLVIGSFVFAFGLHQFTLLTVAALLIAVMLGIGNGTVFKLVPHYFPYQTGKATGIVGAIGGIGGFFPPLVMGAIMQASGSFAGGLYLLGITCFIALLIALFTKKRQKGDHYVRTGSTSA